MDNKPFNFTVDDLDGIYLFSVMAENAVKKSVTEDYECQIHYGSGDNFGSYSAGYRIFLRDRKFGRNLYIYFGLIFNYIKQAGIFAEVDRFSNTGHFEAVTANLEESCHYEINKKEEPFVKLFMPDRDFGRLMSAASQAEQEKLLQTFYDACCKSFIEAMRRGNK